VQHGLGEHGRQRREEQVLPIVALEDEYGGPWWRAGLDEQLSHSVFKTVNVTRSHLRAQERNLELGASHVCIATSSREVRRSMCDWDSLTASWRCRSDFARRRGIGIKRRAASDR